MLDDGTKEKDLFPPHYYDELSDILSPPVNHEYVPAEYRQDQLVYVVAKHPDNMNPRLPFALQRHLNEMSPREFLFYIFEEMSLEERESLMTDEHQRRKSFLGNWPYSKIVPFLV